MSGRTDDTTRETRDQTSPAARGIAGAIRWMAVKLSKDDGFWQLLGHLLPDGKTKETIRAAPFSGIGFYARPKAGSASAEVVINFVGGAPNPVIVASRDEDARRKMADDLADDETAMFNQTVTVRCTKDGHVEIRTASGFPKVLAINDELRSLRDSVAALQSAYNIHTHPVQVVPASGTGATTGLVSAVPGAIAIPQGTTVIRGQ